MHGRYAIFFLFALCNVLSFSLSAAQKETAAAPDYEKILQQLQSDKNSNNEVLQSKTLSALIQASNRNLPTLQQKREALDALKRADQLYPGGVPSSSQFVQRKSLQIKLAMLPLNREIYGNVSVEVENNCYAIGYLSHIEGDQRTSLVYFKCYYLSRLNRLGADADDARLAQASYAQALFDTGDIDASEKEYKDALSALEKSTSISPLVFTRTLGRYASNLYQLGRLDEYEKLLMKEVDTMRNAYGESSKETQFEVGALINFYLSWNRYEEADVLIWRGYNIVNKVDPNGFLAGINAWRAAGSSLRAKQPEEAEQLLEKALFLNEKYEGSRYLHLGSIRNSIAEAKLMENKTDDAINELTSAITFFRSIGEEKSPYAAESHVRLGRIYLSKGDPKSALSEFSQAVAIDKAQLDKNTEGAVWAIFYLSQAQSALGQQEAAKQSRAEVMQIVRRYVSGADRLQVDTLRARQQFGPIVAQYVADLVNQPSPDVKSSFEAVQLANVSDSASTLNAMAARSSSQDQELADLIRLQQDDMGKLRVLDSELGNIANASDNDERTAIWSQRSTVQSRLNATSATLSSKYPSYTRLTDSSPVPLEHVQSLLRNREALVIFNFSDQGGFVWLVRQSSAIVAPLKLTRQQLEQTVIRLRQGLQIVDGNPAPFDTALAYQLFQEIFPYGESLFEDIDHLITIPDGSLRAIPLGLLVYEPPTSNETYRDVKWLISMTSISTLPAVSTFISLRESEGSRIRATLPFLGVGDPVPLDARSRLLQDDSRSPELIGLGKLPDTKTELERIAQLLQASRKDLLLGQEATKEDLLRTALPQMRGIAFATHGLVDGNNIKEPALVLSLPKSATSLDQALLPASEIAQMTLNADWILLSACNTATIDASPEAEMLSALAKAFFYAGAHTVLASHWYISSTATTQLTTSIFENYVAAPQAGLAHALQRAEVKMIAEPDGALRYSHPVYWAPFSLIGDDLR
jgi:CHAT domain-containing protein/predicted negative regulator of RcsB-dependent stress response